MDLPLVAAVNWSYWGYLAQGIIALGCVIFIHEFGHFAAAKLCGVRVDKFYLGFDFFGLKLFRFRWGETEYGIGAFPFGGYVSMYGQNDNPGKQAEEARLAREKALAEGKPLDGAAAEMWDPRSYPAQSVPERMFIISAGVIMNAITAFLFAAVAYFMGVQYTPTIVASVTPGGPAWTQDVRPGDVITQVEDVKQPRFEADLRTRAYLSDMKKGLEFKFERKELDEAGKEKTTDFDLRIHPAKPRKDMPPALGIGAGPSLPKLLSPKDPNDPKDVARSRPTREETPARAAKATSGDEFQSGDEFIKVGDREVKSDLDIVTAMIENSGENPEKKPLKITILRNTTDDKNATTAKLLEIDVAPRPTRTLGLVMEFGPVTGIQNDSPAAKAGIHVGDRLKSIDGEPIGDPMTASERFRRKQKKTSAGTPWKVVVERLVDGKPQEISLDVTPRTADRLEPPSEVFGSMSIPVLGVAYSVPPKIAAIEAGEPTAIANEKLDENSRLKVGDVITQFKVVPSDKPYESGETMKARAFPLLEEDAGNWPVFATRILNELRGDVKIELTTAGEKPKVVTLEPADSKEFFNTDRGFNFQPIRPMRKAEDVSQALDYAYVDTRDNMTQVYRFLHAMWIGQIPINNLGGIVTIADQAGQSASGGFPVLLLFLTMLSCNLAVLNFLPFPVLDGGHMVFLTYEAIFRRPPPERLVGYLNMVGFFCLMGLMLFALTNDVLRYSK